MRFTYYLLTIALLASSLPASALEIDDIETLFAGNNIAGLQKLQSSPVDATELALYSYPSLLLRYRLAAALIQNGQKTAAKKVLKEATFQARMLAKNAPQHLKGEFQVLLGAIYGLKIIVHPLSTIGLNRKANKALQQAQTLDPDNPRALLMLGVAKFQTPALFGGSSKQALALLQQGLQAIDPKDPVSWGAVDLHLWLGRVLTDLGKKEQGLHHYRQALQLSPENHWVLKAMAGDGFRVERR